MARSLILLMKISVIICTHNAKEAYLRRTLQALHDQSLPRQDWELILVDNASEPPAEGRFRLSWHPQARILRETELGLTPARLRGIKESRGEILAFVDDDNLLSRNYLVNALQIADSHPFLGAWGGSCLAEYEEEPPSWFKDYEGNIAVRKVDRESWSNCYFDYASTPVGAGMCVRHEVAKRYCSRLQSDTNGISLDRKGTSLMSCGDHDMAWTSMELGLGVGVFPELELVHIIPEGRTRSDYILKLLEADACSSALLRKRITGHMAWPPDPKAFPRLRGLAHAVKQLIMPAGPSFAKSAHQAVVQGVFRARWMCGDSKKGSKTP